MPYKNYTVAVILFFISYVSMAQPLKVGIAGLNHDHVYGIINQYKKGEAIIIGIAEPDTALSNKFRKRFDLPDSIFFKSVQEMLMHITPDAVLAYNAIADHLSVIEACAHKGISVMVEKPLATTMEQAKRIEMLAKQYRIHVLTNYETTWYPSNQQVYKMVHEEKAVGHVRKMIVHMGHQGPKEIGCSTNFLAWLTDPVKNGGGALMDFGCYGANLMTWLMNGEKPVSVTAITKHIKPDMYPKVDDDATILLEYPGATGIIEASWNWTFGIKDFEVFGEKSYVHAVNENTLVKRDTVHYYNVSVEKPIYSNNLTYLADIIRGKIQPGNDLSSLANNLIVVEILSAARQSAASGKKIYLTK